MKTGGRSHRSNRFWRIPICWRTPICWQQRTIRWLPGIRLEARIARGFLGRRHDRPFYQSTTSPSPPSPRLAELCTEYVRSSSSCTHRRVLCSPPVIGRRAVHENRTASPASRPQHPHRLVGQPVGMRICPSDPPWSMTLEETTDWADDAGDDTSLLGGHSVTTYRLAVWPTYLIPPLT